MNRKGYPLCCPQIKQNDASCMFPEMSVVDAGFRSPWQWPPPGPPPPRSKGMTTGTVPTVDPRPGAQRTDPIPKPGVPTSSQQAGKQSRSKTSSPVVAEHKAAENYSSGGVDVHHSTQEPQVNSKTIKHGKIPERHGHTRRSTGTMSSSPKKPNSATEENAKPGKGRKKAKDKPRPSRRPLEPIKEGVLVSLSVNVRS